MPERAQHKTSAPLPWSTSEDDLERRGAREAETWAYARTSARTDLAEVKVAVAKHHVDSQNSLEIMANRKLVRHSDAADLDRTFGNRPPRAADLRLQQQDFVQMRRTTT